MNFESTIERISIDFLVPETRTLITVAYGNKKMNK